MAPGRKRGQILKFMHVGKLYSASGIAKGSGVSCRTVIAELMKLRGERPDVLGHQEVGNMRIFWLKMPYSVACTGASPL